MMAKYCLVPMKKIAIKTLFYSQLELKQDLCDNKQLRQCSIYTVSLYYASQYFYNKMKTFLRYTKIYMINKPCEFQFITFHGVRSYATQWLFTFIHNSIAIGIYFSISDI